MALTIPQKTVADSDARFKVLITGRRFGKTHLCIREICRHAAQNPGAIIQYISPSYRMSKNILLMQLVNKLHSLRWIKQKNEAELTCYLRNGSIIQLKGADNWDSLRGVGLNFVVIDEFQDVPHQAWTEVIRPTLSDKQGKALFCGTPKGVGSWSQRLYTQAIHEADWEAWQFTTIEGGNVPQEEVEAARRDLDDKTFMQEYMATFNTYSGVVAYNFDYKACVKPLPDTITSSIFVGQDFNLSPMSSVIAQVNGNSIHVFDEIKMLGSNTDEVCDELKRRYKNSRIIMYPDSAGRQRKTSGGGRTDIRILQDAGFGVQVKNQNPPIRDRVKSINAKIKNTHGQRSLFKDTKYKKIIH